MSSKLNICPFNFLTSFACRVVYAFGPRIKEPVQEVTSTFLTQGILGTLRECDALAHQVLQSWDSTKISQMPVVLLPLHFDRDSSSHLPSCQHSVVIRTFLTADFMTGVAALPGKELPVEVSGITGHGSQQRKAQNLLLIVGLQVMVE